MEPPFSDPAAGSIEFEPCAKTISQDGEHTVVRVLFPTSGWYSMTGSSPRQNSIHVGGHDPADVAHGIMHPPHGERSAATNCPYTTPLVDSRFRWIVQSLN
jgi:hypothetical protein